MDVYVVITEDRHTDATVDLFADRVDAIRFARDSADNLARGDDVHQIRFNDTSCLVCLQYGESNYVRVMKSDVLPKQ